jgi:hypothetical protein
LFSAHPGEVVADSPTPICANAQKQFPRALNRPIMPTLAK